MAYKVTMRYAYGLEFIFDSLIDATSFMGMVVNNGVYTIGGKSDVEATITMIKVPEKIDGEEVE